MTTVGYGDYYPVTTEGRIVAGVLMTAGVGLFGVFTGFVASWFLEEQEEQQEKHIAQNMRDEIQFLREHIQRLEEKIDALGDTKSKDRP